MNKALLIIANLLCGNLILLILVSSNGFLQSLMINFKVYYHALFSILLIMASFYFLYLARIKTKTWHHLLFGIFTAWLPVVLTTLVLIALSLVPASIDNQQIFKGLLFSLKFSLFISFTSAAIYWLPFGLLNFLYMRNTGS